MWDRLLDFELEPAKAQGLVAEEVLGAAFASAAA